ncbi:MAG: hypothetical protein ABIR47_05175 [Candidatus Kapaibacterium sp.]
MHRTLTMIAAGLIAVAGTAAAQKLSVKQGRTINYRTVGTALRSMSVQGNDQTDTTLSDNRLALTAVKVGKGQIEWKFSDAEADAKGKPGAPTVDKCITDAIGTVLTVTNISTPHEASGPHGALKVKFGTAKSRIRRFFLPRLSQLKPGDTWEETMEDKTANAQMGMSLNATTKYRMTFEGIVDTLGASAARIRWESTSLVLKGEMNAGGNAMKIDGDGTTTGVSYFSMKDGMLLSRTDDMEVAVRVSTSSMLIPVLQKQTSVTVRAK